MLLSACSSEDRGVGTRARSSPASVVVFLAGALVESAVEEPPPSESAEGVATERMSTGGGLAEAPWLPPTELLWVIVFLGRDLERPRRPLVSLAFGPFGLDEDSAGGGEVRLLNVGTVGSSESLPYYGEPEAPALGVWPSFILGLKAFLPTAASSFRFSMLRLLFTLPGDSGCGAMISLA